MVNSESDPVSFRRAISKCHGLMQDTIKQHVTNILKYYRLLLNKIQTHPSRYLSHVCSFCARNEAITDN